MQIILSVLNITVMLLSLINVMKYLLIFNLQKISLYKAIYTPKESSTVSEGQKTLLTLQIKQ